MIDGVHHCQRCRWHQPMNQIVGLCQVHSLGLDLARNNMDTVLAILEAVHCDSPSYHYGREATVVAIGLIWSAMDQWELHGEPHNGPIWVLGTDGDSVDRSTPLYSKLSGLSGLNSQCGKGNTVTGPDPKHVTKCKSFIVCSKLETD
ncbi:hypothetical protein B0H10DRAFT_2165870 [Mycena sp. CBHHK59/15]|nr:hypothetical protein B0H10DRAFT_2165870 [Mycena sp. CBHHK59/15]